MEKAIEKHLFVKGTISLKPSFFSRKNNLTHLISKAPLDFSAFMKKVSMPDRFIIKVSSYLFAGEFGQNILDQGLDEYWQEKQQKGTNI
ncbi:MAG: hypothetical protein AAFR87_01655 [Bacteroidota bacterium]